MPLFRASPSMKSGSRQRKMTTGRRRNQRDEDGSVLSLTRLCLLNLADNMKGVWVKDYAEKYLDQYHFRHIIGPFNVLSGELVEELTCLLCSRKQLSRAALHLLLVPQLRSLSFGSCPGLATSAVCTLIAARCQCLYSLDLSGAQQLSAQVQCSMLSCLPTLRSLSLAGTLCDTRVIKTLAYYCPFLRHLVVSHCHLLSPAALLPLGGGAFSSCSDGPSGSSFLSSSASHSSVSLSCSQPSSSSPSSSSSSSSSKHHPPLPLKSLLALDIGFGEEKGDPEAAAAYLLLSLPCLESVAMAGLAQAFCIIHHREFSQTDAFTVRESVSKLEEVWRLRQGTESGRKMEAGAADEEEDEEEGILWEQYESESDDDASRDEGPGCLLRPAEEKRNCGRGIAEKDRVASGPGDESLILRLRDVQGLSFASLEIVVQLCPDIHSLSLDFDEDEDTGGRSQVSLLAEGLQSWSGQLQSLSIRYSRPLVDLLPALQGVGSSLLSLTLEGVKTSPDSSLLEVIRACPRLRHLLICADPPTTPLYVQDLQEEDDRNFPFLPNLCSLTLNFSYDHSQMKPVMSWVSLTRVLWCLLAGSLLLEKVSLVALPCPLDLVLKNTIAWNLSLNPHRAANSSHVPARPLRCVQHLVLSRTNVTMDTVKHLVQSCKQIKHVDLAGCWEITQRDFARFQALRVVELVWQ